MKPHALGPPWYHMMAYITVRRRRCARTVGSRASRAKTVLPHPPCRQVQQDSLLDRQARGHAELLDTDACTARWPSLLTVWQAHTAQPCLGPWSARCARNARSPLRLHLCSLSHTGLRPDARTHTRSCLKDTASIAQFRRSCVCPVRSRKLGCEVGICRHVGMCYVVGCARHTSVVLGACVIFSIIHCVISRP